MDRLAFDDVELTYELQGHGERIVLVHASPFVSWYVPLVEQLAAFSTLRYRRRLLEAGSGGYRPLTVGEDAASCIRLMDHVGWSTAHIVGHSYGALVALQLAIDAPERVRSVALLEPAARGISRSEQVAAALELVVAAYRSGDKAGAVDGFLRHVCGDGYRAVLDRAIPGAFGEALDEADLFFQAEMPAVQRWSFGPADAAHVTQPVLNVLGAERPAVRGRERARAVLVPAGRTPVGAGRRTSHDGAEPGGVGGGSRALPRRPALVGLAGSSDHGRCQRSRRAKWNAPIVRPSRM
jgi:pimeloyl-ACP methyl ester carboxylesterase